MKHLDIGDGELKKLLLRCYFKLYKIKITSVGGRDVRIEIQNWYLPHQILLRYRRIRLAYKVKLDAGLRTQYIYIFSVAEISSNGLSVPFY